MGFFGTMLFLATAGVTIYYFPTLFFGISWESLSEIRHSNSISALIDVWKNMGWTAETAVEEANKIFTISIVVCIVIGIMVVSSILYSYRKFAK